MIKKVLISFATVAVAAASAATYHVRILENSTINGTELKAGEYKVDVLEKDNKAVFHKGHDATETKVKVETANGKFRQTTFRYDRDASGKMTLQELNIGGSTTKLIFSE
jgi:hypothetical protein